MSVLRLAWKATTFTIGFAILYARALVLAGITFAVMVLPLLLLLLLLTSF